MTNAFLYRMPSGIAGTVNRAEHATIEPGLLDADYPCLAYGIFVKLVAGKYRPIAQADNAAAVVKGMLVRPYPTNEPYGTTAAEEALGEGLPSVTDYASIMTRGYLSAIVTANGATALADITKGTQVYVRDDAAIGPALGSVGDIEAGSATGNAAVTGAFFMGTPDADGNCEIAYNI